jgi:hypothetical protein
MTKIYHLTPIPKHVIDLWDAAKALTFDEESCKRFPRLTKAIIAFEERLVFKDKGKVFSKGGDAP